MRTALFALALFAAAPAQAQDRHLYVGVTLLDPATETVRPDSYILTEGNRIAAIGRGRPRDSATRTPHGRPWTP